MHNGVRFDTWALARGGNAIIPFYRAFITDHIVGPENGEASRRLAAAMQQHLLTRDPYRSYDVTLDELFASGSFRVHEDLYILSDQVFGWDSDYRVLRDAGVEGVRAHPGTYASGVLGTVWNELAKAQFRPRGIERAQAHRRRSGRPRAAFPCRPRGSRSRPDRWSGSRVRIRASARCGPPRRTGTSSSTTPHSAPASARSRRRGTRSSRRFPTVLGTRSSRSASTSSLAGFRGPGCGSSSVSPASRCGDREERRRSSSSLWQAIGVVVLNALGLFADLHFVLPVAPAFVLLGAGGSARRRRATGR